MGTVATAGDKEFEKTPAGVHVARCYMVADLGTQDTTYMGKPKKTHKVLITWELPQALMEDGRPFSVSSRYTLSLFDQALLRQHLEAWRGKGFTEEELVGFDVKNVLGAYCQVMVVHEQSGDKTYANVKAVMALPNGANKPAPVNPNVYFDVDTGDINVLPEWVQNVVKKSDEWKTKGLPPVQPTKAGKFDDMKDDIPF